MMFAAMIVCAPAYAKAGVIPVSYTHLDVYKRQGVYMVKELAAPEGYLLTTAYQGPIVMCCNEAAYVRFAHSTKDYLLIETVDAQTRQPIPGAQYNVTKMDGDLVGEYSANDHGVVEVGPLAPGFYVVKQIIAPTGYSICTETQTIEVISGRVLNTRFANYKLEGIVIESVDQTTPVSYTHLDVYKRQTWA